MQLEFTDRAERQLADTLEYIETSFGEKVALDLSVALYHLLSKLQDWPELGRRVEKDSNLRRLVFRKRMLIFYRVFDTKIIVKAIKTSYQNYSQEDVS